MNTRENRRDGAAAISAAIDKVVGLACALLIGAMTVVVIVGVIFRYAFNAPLNWVEETSRYLMIWGASLAISLGVSAAEHVGLTVILDSMKKPLPRKVFSAFINLVVFAFLLFMFIYSLNATIEGRTQMTQALGISMFVPKLAVPLAMGLSAIQVVLVTIRILKSADGRYGQGIGYIDI